MSAGGARYFHDFTFAASPVAAVIAIAHCIGGIDFAVILGFFSATECFRRPRLGFPTGCRFEIKANPAGTNRRAAFPADESSRSIGGRIDHPQRPGPLRQNSGCVMGSLSSLDHCRAPSSAEMPSCLVA